MKHYVFAKALQIGAIALGSLATFTSVSVGRELPSDRSCPFRNSSDCERNLVQRSEDQKTEAVTQQFYCGLTRDGVPTTFVKNSRGTYPVIRWVSRVFDDAGYVPETRCRQVSSKFQQFYERGLLNYVTTGRVNNQPVICVSNAKDGPCLGILFTLKPEQNANRTLEQLFDIKVNASAGPLEESNARYYLDFDQFIDNQAGVVSADSIQAD